MLIASVKRASTLIKAATAHGIFDKPISKTSLDILALPFPLYAKSQATYYNKKIRKFEHTLYLITSITMNCIARLSRPYSKTKPTWKLICNFGIIKEQIA
jgi:hypothetical protein